MAVEIANPKQAVTLNQARVMRIDIEHNPCKQQIWIDLYVVWGYLHEGVFCEHMDPETAAIAQYYRISDGSNPHARPALPGEDPAGNGPPLGRCDTCDVWHDRGLDQPCPEDGCEGTVQPYNGLTRLVSALAEGVPELVKDAVILFRGQDGAPAAFEAGGATLAAALDAFLASPEFLTRALDPESGLYNYNVIRRACYKFLSTEVVPEPVEGVPTVLLATT